MKTKSYYTQSVKEAAKEAAQIDSKSIIVVFQVLQIN